MKDNQASTPRCSSAISARSQSSSKASSISTIFFEVVSSRARTRIAGRMRTVDHLIVGVGVIGASIAYHLAVRGETNVLVIDAGKEPGAGSTSKPRAD